MEISLVLMVFSIYKTCLYFLLAKRKAKAILYERAWQMALYCSLEQCTAPDIFVSPDVGAYFGDKGYIDFTLHQVKGTKKFWGLELLRESNLLEEHCGRFLSKGKYANMVEKFDDFRVIDFRKRNKKGLNWGVDDVLSDPKLVIVFYDDCWENIEMATGELNQKKIREIVFREN